MVVVTEKPDLTPEPGDWVVNCVDCHYMELAEAYVEAAYMKDRHTLVTMNFDAECDTVAIGHVRDPGEPTYY